MLSHEHQGVLPKNKEEKTMKYLKLSCMLAVIVLLVAACGPATPVVVEKEVVVEKPVVETVVVEKEVVVEKLVEVTPEAKPEAPVLEIYHWWTSGSEKAAMDALIAVYMEEYPDVTVLESPVAGGGGIAMREVIHTLMLAGEAPDAFQSYPAGLWPYYEADMLQPVDEVWTKEAEAAVPQVVRDAFKLGGHYYGVPSGVQQAGIVYYNIPILEEYGLAKPTSWDEFWAICDTLKAEGVDAVALGDRNAWPLTYIFRTLTASEGIDYYEDFINGKVTDPSNPQLVDSLTKLNKMLDYVNADHAALTWDEAVAKVVKGEAAMNIMGECATGEFEAAEVEYGKDYGTFYAPGAQDIFGVSLDTFALPKGAKHPTNAINFQKVWLSKEGQLAFNAIKGQIPARTDVELTPEFPGECFETMRHFKEAKYYRPGMWSGTPSAFMGQLTDIISAKIGVERDVNGAASAIASLQAETEWPKEWDLTP
jgi:glucose/mannose transport system substrate-binding protein